MIVTLQTERIRTIGQVAAFVAANEPVDFEPLDPAGAYAFVATEREGANGRIRRVYRAADVPTPYDKLRSLPGADACLKPAISFAELDAQARVVSDLQAARALNAERVRLFRTIAGAWPDVA